MTLAQLEQRLSKLEKKVRGLDPSPQTSAEAWRGSSGRFADDPGFEEIVRLGREYRVSLRPGRKKKGRAGNGRL